MENWNVLIVIFLLGMSTVILQSALAKGPSMSTVNASESDCALMWRYIQADDAVNENLSIIDQNLERASEDLSNVGIRGSEAQLF